MTSIGTTAVMLFSTGNRRASFLVHADAANTHTVRISGTDPLAALDFEELLAGQSISFENYKGDVYAIAITSAQLVYVPFVVWDTDAELVKA